MKKQNLFQFVYAYKPVDRCLYGLHKKGIYPLRTYRKFLAVFDCSRVEAILGDPGADSGGEGKSKQEGKYDTKEK